LAGGRYDVGDAVALFAKVNEQDFAAAQWCQPNMSSRAYRDGGLLVPSEVEVISQYYAWYRALMGITAKDRHIRPADRGEHEWHTSTGRS
jgi:Rieske 2Fe-2S family protein